MACCQSLLFVGCGSVYGFVLFIPQRESDGEIWEASSVSEHTGKYPYMESFIEHFKNWTILTKNATPVHHGSVQPAESLARASVRGHIWWLALIADVAQNLGAEYKANL